MPMKKNVVIVGGGGAGATVARTLSQQLDATKYNLTLISAHPFFIHYVASLRILVTARGHLEDQALIPYDKLFVNNNGRFKQGTVTAIEATGGSREGGRIVLEGGETFHYDVLVLAPGSTRDPLLTFPLDGEKTRQHIQEWREKFRSARKVVIAGGGAVGIELAGELRDFYPEKKVAIVHVEDKLLNPAYPDKFRKDVERRVRANDIQLILDDYVDYVDSFPASTTLKGVPLGADLVVAARGARPNSSFIATSLGKDAVTERGFVRIQPTMQLVGYPNIFAVGDVIDFPEQKQFAKYPGHASVVAPNVVSVLGGGEPKKVYKGGFEAIMVTLGQKHGAGFIDFLWGLMLGNWVVSFVKGKGLFISMTRKTLGYPS